MHNVFFVVTWPRDILLPGLKRRTQAVQAGDHTLVVFIYFFEYLQADARHDAHAHDNVRRVSKLHANL